MNRAFKSALQKRDIHIKITAKIHISDQQFFVGMRTSGLAELSTNQPCDKTLEILLWQSFGAPRAKWRAASQSFLASLKSKL